MIFYFSGTGNSEYVARRIAAATGDGVSSIAECVAHRRFDFDASIFRCEELCTDQ